MTPSRIGRHATDDLLFALQIVPTWMLTPEDWRATEELLAELAAAVAEADTARVVETTIELELQGRRVSRVAGQEPEPADGRVPLPGPVRDRVVALVHALEPDAPAGSPPTGAPGRPGTPGAGAGAGAGVG